MRVWSYVAPVPGAPDQQCAGISPLEQKVQVIRDFPKPATHRKLRGFLGLVNFYHRFLPHAANLLHPLNELLSGVTSRTQALAWADEAQAVFQAVKEALADATLLSHPRPLAPLAIMSDASGIAIGAVLQQQIDGHWHPISYFSKKTISTRNTIQRI